MSGTPKRSKKLSSFAVRLQSEMTHLGLAQTHLASALKISQGTVSGWFNRDAIPQPRTLAQLADILGVTPEWLLHGKEPKLNARSRAVGEQVIKSLPTSSLLRETPPVYSARAPSREIPLLSWAQAGEATSFEEIPPDWQQRIVATVADEKAFAVTIRGDSMEPRLQEGDSVVLLPGTPARNGDLVVANIKDEGFVLKILTLVGGDPARLKLTSYNPAYPPMELAREQFHWIYPVHSVIRILRR